MIHLTTDQRSPEWYKARLGRLTSSRAADMLATIKSGEAAARRNLRVQLVLERLTGKFQAKEYVSPAMQDGIDREVEAGVRYQNQSLWNVMGCGFIAHDTLMAGCSPDGSVDGFAGIVEIKCPLAATHLETLKTRAVPSEYRKQIVHQLWITGARWCDWVSYQPDMPERLQLQVIRVPRDEAEIASYELMARLFLDEVDRELETVQGLTA